jgi:hypothetical protein
MRRTCRLTGTNPDPSSSVSATACSAPRHGRGHWGTAGLRNAPSSSPARHSRPYGGYFDEVPKRWCGPRRRLGIYAEAVERVTIDRGEMTG